MGRITPGVFSCVGVALFIRIGTYLLYRPDVGSGPLILRFNSRLRTFRLSIDKTWNAADSFPDVLIWYWRIPPSNIPDANQSPLDPALLSLCWRYLLMTSEGVGAFLHRTSRIPLGKCA